MPAAERFRGHHMTSFAKLASTLLFGLAANADNLTVGLAYGLKRRRIGGTANLLIAAVTTVITLLALIFGREVRQLLPNGLPNIVGGGLLAALAIWGLVRDRDGVSERSALSSAARFAGRHTVGFREGLLLAGALSINNISLAIAGGIGGIDYAPAAVSIFCWSVAMLLLGQWASAKLAGWDTLGRILRSPVSGNAVLLVAGAAMLVGY